MTPGEYGIRWPRPGTAAERHIAEATQPGFLAAASAGVQQARAASCADGAANSTHSAVTSWGRFTILGLRCAMRRPLDPLATSLERKLREVDLVEAWAWWLVVHVGVNTETAWSYVGVVNAWHERAYGVRLAGGLSLARVHSMLDGLQRLSGAPVVRRRRIGVRPRHLRDGIAAALDPRRDAAHANLAALFESGLVALARAGELAAGRGGFNPRVHPSRRDVHFTFDRHGQLLDCVIFIVNSKARGAERFRKMPMHLPVRGSLLSPGLSLFHLCHCIDHVPYEAEPSTPLFRVPSTNAILTVAAVRTQLRRCMSAIGQDGSAYGAHSLRIGGATAMAWLQYPREAIMTRGRWRSDAYLRYIRERRLEDRRFAAGVASADTDDYEADFVGIDEFDFDESDYE